MKGDFLKIPFYYTVLSYPPLIGWFCLYKKRLVKLDQPLSINAPNPILSLCTIKTL